MVRYFVFFVFSSLVVFGITVYYRLGGYKSPEISRQEISGFHIVGKKHLGAYHKIGAVITEVESWAKTNNIPCAKTFGEYYDDPREKDEDRLQSVGGCILSSPLSEELTKTLPTGFLTHLVEAGPRVVAIFKGAPSIGPFKVYPAVEAFLSENHLQMNGAVIEIYEFFGDRKARTEYQFRVK